MAPRRSPSETLDDIKVRLSRPRPAAIDARATAGRNVRADGSLEYVGVVVTDEARVNEVEARDRWIVAEVEAAFGRPVEIDSIRRIVGPFRRRQYLAHTDQGSALVTLRATARPLIHILERPGHRYTCRCLHCGGTFEMHDPVLPVRIHCAFCTSLHELDRPNGEVRWVLVRAGEVVAQPQRAQVTIVSDNEIRTRQSAAASPLPHRRRAEPRRKKAPSRPVKRPAEPYTIDGWTLHERQVTTKAGNQTTFYFFSKRADAKGRAIPKPDTHRVVITARTGMPVLRRVKAGEDHTVVERAGTNKARKKATARPQCVATRPDDKQCRNSARAGSDYCASHKGYQPRSVKLRSTSDTSPAHRGAEDTAPRTRKGAARPRRTRKASANGARPARLTGSRQVAKVCAARTLSDKPCTNSARERSKYCGQHKGYRRAT